MKNQRLEPETFKELIWNLIPELVNWPMDELEGKILDYFKGYGFDPNKKLEAPSSQLNGNQDG